MADVIALHKPPTLDQAAVSINRNFERATDNDNKSHRYRLAAGFELLAAWRRVEAGEAGDVKWWDWAKAHIARKRKDINKVMALATAADPEAAHDWAKAKNRAEKQRQRQRQRDDADVSAKEQNQDDEDEMADRVAAALAAIRRFVAGMTATQVRRFKAALQEEWKQW